MTAGTVRFGVHTGLQNISMAELTSVWRRIEELGFDWISIWDHFYSADLNGYACQEAIAAHTALAMLTERVRVGSLVYCAGYRHPAVLANAMATIDELSDGRVDFGIGAGWCEPEYRAYGIEFPTAGRRLDLLTEAVTCVRSLLHDDVTNFTGDHFTMTDAHCEPRPVQPHVPIWIGGGGEKRTLRIAAEFADGWNVPYVSPEAFAHKRRVLHDHCASIGRDPGEIRCAVNVGLAWDDESMRAQYGRIAEAVRPGVLSGTDDDVVARIGEYVAAGADQVNIVARAPFDVDSLQRLAPLFAEWRGG